MTVGERDKAEEAVRDYLRALELVRRGQRTSPPRNSAMGRPLAAQAKLNRKRLQAAEAAFVRHAASWARRQRVSGRTLREFGVPEDVLSRAGIELTSIDESIRARYGRRAFTVRDLAVRLGVPVAAVRRTVATDVAEGTIVEIGTRARSRGRPAITYQVVDQSRA
ncbi:MAG: hypothetical protein ACLGHT_12370 [Acidimicrobiia bacterium]